MTRLHRQQFVAVCADIDGEPARPEQLRTLGWSPSGKRQLDAPSIPHSASVPYPPEAVKVINGQWVIGRGGANPGSTANWHIYPDTGWVGVVLSNYDGQPMQEILDREMQAVTGQP